jgi:hypothetical protein
MAGDIISEPGVALGAEVGPLPPGCVRTLELGARRFVKYEVREGSLRCDSVREAGCEGAGEPVRLRREAVLFSRLSGTLPTTGGRTGAGEDMAVSEVVETPAVRLRVLALEGVRW